jgi:glycolate oxidase FAD binding subunit
MFLKLDKAKELAYRLSLGALGVYVVLCLAEPEEIRRNVEVFQPQPGGLAALSERVRHSFDPKSILNRGRMTRESAT